MRICELHRDRAVEILVSKIDGTEYDLCPKCIELFFDILNGKPEWESGRTRTPGTVKKAKG